MENSENKNQNTNFDIQSWLKEQRVAGAKDDELKRQLTSAGYTEAQVNSLFLLAEPAVAAPAILATPPASTKKSKKVYLLIGIAAAIILLIGGGVFAYLKGYLLLPFLTPSAEEILLKSLDQLANAQSGDFGFTFKMVAEARSPGAKPYDWDWEAIGDSPMIRSSKNAKIVADVKQIQTALELYYQDHTDVSDLKGRYPEGSGLELGGPSALCLSSDGFGATCGSSIVYMGTIPKHPDNKLYVYTVNQDRKGYTIEFRYVGSPEPAPVKATESEFPQLPDQSNISEDYLELFAEAMSSFINYIPADLTVEGKISAFTGAKKDEAKWRSGIAKFSGSYSSGGTSLSVDIESRAKDGKYYVLVKKIPSFFFFDLSAFQNKWVVIDPTSDTELLSFFDYEEFVDELPSEDVAKNIRDELPFIFKAALNNKVFISKLEAVDEVNGRSAYRVSVKFNSDQLPAFVDAYQADAKSRGANIGAFGDALEILKNPKLLERIKEPLGSSGITLWAARRGLTPLKVEYSLVFVPPDRAEKLKTKQFRIVYGMTFDHLNEEPNVEVPKETISLEEVERLMRGMTVEEYQFEKQRRAISDIRSALTNYYYKNKKYPDILSQLLDKPPPESEQYSWRSQYQSYFYYSKRKAIPLDLYTNQPFEYQTSGNDYALVYSIKFPTTTSEQGIFGGFGGMEYYQKQFVEGRNTATKDFLSREVEAAKDDDMDGLTNEEEIRHGTSKYNRDTDYDGYSDGDEVRSGHDPLTSAKTGKRTNNPMDSFGGELW